MAINVKRLNRVRLHSVGGIEVLETINSGVKKPAFRQNGYEVDGITKKSFALEFDRGNSEEIVLSKPILIGERVELNFILSSVDFSVNQYLFSDQNGNIRCNIGTDKRLGAVGCTAELWIDGVSVPSNTPIAPLGANIRVVCTSTINSTINRVANWVLVNQHLNATIYYLEIATEQFLFREGLGNQVYGSSGTIGTIETSNAQGIERINYGMWLKGDDTNGWNPYT